MFELAKPQSLSSLQSVFSFCQSGDSCFTNELISPRNSGVELLVELVATNPTQKARLNLACLVFWATHTVAMAQKGQPHAWLVMSFSVTRAFTNLCSSNLWNYSELGCCCSHHIFHFGERNRDLMCCVQTLPVNS